MSYIITLEELLNDLQNAKQMAIEQQSPNSLIAAVMAQAKLMGYTEPAMRDVTPAGGLKQLDKPALDLTLLTDAELRALADIYERLES